MNDFQRYLAEEFAEDYEEGRLSRREALKLITSVTGSLVAANSILAACSPPAPTASPHAVVTTGTAEDTPGAVASPGDVAHRFRMAATLPTSQEMGPRPIWLSLHRMPPRLAR